MKAKLHPGQLDSLRTDSVRTKIAIAGIVCGTSVVMLAADRPATPITADTTRAYIDFRCRIGPISPYIYGMAMPGPIHFRQLGVPLVRWGGNPSTRYNWVRGNSWNAARDWHFANGNYGSTTPQSRQPSGVADSFVATNNAHSTATLLTIPTLGWVARDDNAAHASLGVPPAGGPPVAPGSDAIRGYDPTENRQRVSIRSESRKGKPFGHSPDLFANAVYQDEWVHHLTRRFGNAATHGVKFYAMDNEPDLWDTTHTDMHPTQPDYQEMLDRFFDYANAVKNVDPTAQITGPVSSGWLAYFFSSRDRGDDQYATHADRTRHNNQAFIPWFLQRVAERDAHSGRRSLDVLDVHYYPQGDGIYSGRTDSETNERRLRSTRALWDPHYRDESWIDAEVKLIPRLHAWVKRAYPGTHIGLTEWNWGAERTINGGLAVAEVLGILGREQVDLACYWTAPPVGSPAFLAYQLYRNADEHGHGFGDEAVPLGSEMPADIACFAANDTRLGVPTVILINESMSRTHRVQLVIDAQRLPQYISTYRLSAECPTAIVHLANIALSGHQVDVTVPPTSITLYRGVRSSHLR